MENPEQYPERFGTNTFSPFHPSRLDQDAANPPTPPRVETVPLSVLSQDFETKWAQFLSESSNPSLYGADHKTLAELGYTWAVITLRRIAEGMLK